MNKDNVYIVPNLTYYPRAAQLPKNTIMDGSVALLIPKGNINIDISNLEYFSSKEFTDFYRIVKNHGTRSLNVDRNAVYFWGLKKSI
jgi:DNA (cytosine-5)-methyltransferase 1